MPAVVTPEKIAVNLKLNNGLTPTGSVKTLNMKMGNMSLTGFDAAKALAIMNLIQPCLVKTIHKLEKVETSDISD